MRSVRLITCILITALICVSLPKPASQPPAPIGQGLDEEVLSDPPWQQVFEVDGQWATAIIPYNGKLYLGERDYINHTAYIYESSDGVSFAKKYNTNADQVFVMGVNENNNTLYIGTLWRIGQGIGGLFYLNQSSFGYVPNDIWWNSSTVMPAVPLSMHMYKGDFYVGGLCWGEVAESGNKMWVKYEGKDGIWNWTDMSASRLGSVIEAYSMEEYMGKLFVGTFEPAKVVVYDEVTRMWNNSLTGIVDGPTPGNSGVIELINYSGILHALTWKEGFDWYFDGLTWSGGNVTRYGGFGRAIEHNGYLYAGTTPFYGGIKPWSISNISRFNGSSWTETELVNTTLPLYFAKFDGYVYATAGRRVYRMNASTSPPQITEPPTNLMASLIGPGLSSVNITWDPSTQDSYVVNYTVYHSNIFKKDREGYEVLVELPRGSSYYVHSMAGHGDPENHFYYVQANGLNSSAASVRQVGKLVMNVSPGLQLISVPLEGELGSLSSIFSTISYDRMLTYNASLGSKGWTNYATHKPWSRVDSYYIERGYWVNVTSAGQLTIAGLVPEQRVIHLYPGWNLVPFSSFEPYNLSRVIAETGATRVEMCDLGRSPYRLTVMTGSTPLIAGQAYWIYVPSGTNWIIS